MTPAINSMLKGMNAMVSGFEHMNTASAGAFDTRSISLARTEMAKASAAMKQYEDSLSKASKEQAEFNSTAKASTSSMSGLIGKVGALAAGYMSLQAVQGAMDMSDTYSQTTARLGLMNDGLQTTAELQTEIFNAANDSHASYQSMSDMVSKLGLMAGDAFSSSDEIVDFAEQVSKQFVISGAGAGEASNAMLQLTQAMASGVLRGDELNSIFENSPTLIQTIADYLGVPIGEIRNMASEGEITADIIKNSMFKAANSTDAKFEAMGMTFGQAWTVFQNKSGRAFQGVFTQMGQLANSDELDGFLNGLAGGVSAVASGISTIGTGISNVLSNDGVQNLGGTINVVLNELQQDISESTEKIVGRLTERSPEFQAALTDTANAWNDYVETMSRGNDTLNGLDWETGFADFLADYAESILKQVEFLGDVATVFADQWNFVNAVMAGDFEGANEWLDQIKGDTYEMQQDAFNSGEKVTTFYAQGVESALPTMQAAAQRSTETAMAPMTTLPTAANQIGANTTSSFAGGLLINQAIVTSSSQGIADKTTETIRPLENKLYTIGQNSTLGMSNAITNTSGAVSTSSSGLYSAAINPMYPLQNDLTNVGTNSVTGMSGAIAGGQKDAEISAGGVTAGINKMFEPLPGNTRTIADYAMAGLEAGIGDSGGVEGAIVSLTGLLLSTFKDKLGIHSPSTEMYDIGTNTMQGLFNSLADSDLVKFCENIVADMKAAFEAGSFNLQAGIEYIGSGAAEFFKSIGIGGASLGQLITPLAGDVTSGFGYRSAEETNGVGSTWHEGIDIGAGYGTPIGAAGAGTVIFAGYNGGYGNMVEIDHGGGLTSLYAHMESIATSLGQTVSAGQTIGYVGSTGNSTGAHLHFGLYQDGQAIDPGALWGYSSGTMSATAGLHLVGENGPEIIGFNGGETVLNSKKTKLFQSQGNYGGLSVSGGQGVTVQVNMNGVTISNDMDIEVVADRLGSLIVEKMRTRASVA
jgi:tape measure domain-containing protein